MKIKSTRMSVRVAISALALVVSACNSGGSAAAPATTSGGSGGDSGGGGGTTTLTAAVLGTGGIYGSGYPGYFELPCTSIGTSTEFGTNLENDSYQKIMTYDTSGGFSLQTDFYEGSSCSGNEAFVYVQYGTYTIGAASTSVTGGYDVEYDATSEGLEVMGSNFSGAWATSFNSTNCLTGFGLGGSGFSTTANSESYTVAGLNCTDGFVMSFDFPPLGYFYDVIVPSSLTSVTTFSDFQQSAFYMGQYTSYPTSASTSW